MKGLRGALSAALGLALMQLVLSSSQGGGQTAGLLSAAFDYPAKWVRAITNPNTPFLPDLSKGVTTSLSSSAPANGLSGTGTPTGTGSHLISV